MGERQLRFPAWIGVVCDDLEKQRNFYRDVLGFRVTASGEDWIEFDLGPGVDFELIGRSAHREYDRTRYQVGFAVDDIESVAARLRTRGAEQITEVIEGSRSRWAYFRDAEGNVFEIKQG